jgi:glutathione S-transferase
MSNLTAIVTCLALLLYVLLSLRVALARGKFNISAPATTGHPVFERMSRIQQNTGEQLLIMLPALWLFSIFVVPLWASLLGLVWIAGRILYAVGYLREPERRLAGFAISFAATGLLLLGAFVGAVWQLLHTGM